jgi:hypothetical protein
MSITSKLAIAAVLTVIAAPAFAGDQDSAALAVSSGRYLPEVQMSVRPTANYGGAYASAVNPGRARTQAQDIPSVVTDFQAGGR